MNSNEQGESGLTRSTYNVEEAAKILGIGVNTAYEAIKAGRIPAIVVSKRRIVVPRSVIERLLNPPMPS